MNRVIKFRLWSISKFDSGDPLSQPSLKMIDDLTVEEPNLMQYTGLSDRDGKDIYEGDLLLDEVLEARWLVVFHEGSFSAVPHPGGGHPILLRDIRDAVTVVGNVFETEASS